MIYLAFSATNNIVRSTDFFFPLTNLSKRVFLIFFSMLHFSREHWSLKMWLTSFRCQIKKNQFS